jgi:hypothetical protein
MVERVLFGEARWQRQPMKKPWPPYAALDTNRCDSKVNAPGINVIVCPNTTKLHTFDHATGHNLTRFTL